MVELVRLKNDAQRLISTTSKTSLLLSSSGSTYENRDMINMIKMGI